MSLEENKAIERRVVEEIFNKHNLDAIGELIHPNWSIHGSGTVDTKGPEGMRQYASTFVTAFPDFHVTIEDMVAEGDKVACRMTVRGTHKGKLSGIAPTGKQITVTAVSIHRVADGKEVEAWMGADQLGMLEQLGVIPSKG